MHVFQRIWKDIQRGENIDLYLTVIVAIGLVALNLTGFAPSTAIGPLTLAVLGLLAIAVLGNRYRIEQLLENSAKVKESLFIEDYPPSFKNDMLVGTELWMIGVSLNRTIRNYYSEIERKIKRGDTIKVLVVHPDGAALEMAANRSYALTDIEQSRRQILDSLQYLCNLQKIAPGKIEIRTIHNPLAYGVIAINPNSASGTLYIEHFPYKTVVSRGFRGPKIHDTGRGVLVH